MSVTAFRLKGNVELSTIEMMDDGVVRELYGRDPEPSLEDLRRVLAMTTPTLVRELIEPINIDVSSMYTIARGLCSGIAKDDWSGCVSGIEDGLSDLLLSTKARGIWLWLAYELLLKSVHRSEVELVATNEKEHPNEVTGSALGLADIPAGSINTWVWDLDSSMASIRWYRHRIAGPITIYHRRQMLSNDAATALNYVMGNSPLSTGEIYEQVVSRPDIVLTGALIEVNERIRVKKIDSGSGSSSSRVAGAQILQAALTHDLSTGAAPNTLFL